MKEMYSAQGYDTAWEERWDDMKRYGPYSRHVRRWIHKLIAPLDFKSVLDAGCGQGELLSEIRVCYPQVDQIAGIDFSPASVEITRSRLKTGVFEVIDLQAEHLDQQYDLSLSIDVMEHIPDDIAALHHLRQMTRKYALISSIQGSHLPAWEAEVVGHVRNYRRGELAQKIRAANFVVENVVEWGFPFYSPFYRWMLTFLGGQGTDGAYGWRRKFLANVLYQLFRLNLSRRGDLVMVLARVEPPS